MSKFIVSEWFANRAKLNIQIFSIEGVEFELMALSESLIDDVKSCVSYEEMLSLAANSGISYNGKRVVDDEELNDEVTAPSFVLELYPSESQRGVAGRFIAEARENRRSGARARQDRFFVVIDMDMVRIDDATDSRAQVSEPEIQKNGFDFGRVLECAVFRDG